MHNRFLLYNIRYPALFLMFATGLFGILKYKKSYGKIFIISGLAGFLFVVAYKFLFIDYFDEKYVSTFLEIGLHTTSQLLIELFQGLTTVFNPFIHIANPSGGIINVGIYGLGLLNIFLMVFLFTKNKLLKLNFSLFLWELLASSVPILFSISIRSIQLITV